VDLPRADLKLAHGYAGPFHQNAEQEMLTPECQLPPLRWTQKAAPILNAQSEWNI
jgi:hypothetical protein